MYTGTLCIEIALNDVPVIMVGKSRYNKKGFTIDITTKQEYKDIFDNGVPPLSNKGKEIAKIYGYFYFIKNARRGTACCVPTGYCHHYC